jgi:hypothetical protein
MLVQLLETFLRACFAMAALGPVAHAAKGARAQQSTTARVPTEANLRLTPGRIHFDRIFL